MARIRYLKPDFFKDEDLAELPFETRLFFAGLWNFADKAGRLEDRPLRLKAEIFPYDKVDVDKCLDLLSKPKNGSGKPFLQRYKVGQERFIQITGWDKHQRPHHTEQDSHIPPAPLMEKGMEKEREHDRSTELRNGVTTVKRPLHLSDDDFLKTLKANPAYKHIDFEFEFGKMDAYLLTKRGRIKTRRFIVAWLNRIDRPMGSVSQARQPKKPDPKCEMCHGTGRAGQGNCICVLKT